MVTLFDVIEFIIHKRPGLTEAELAEAIYGDRGYQQRVNQDCRRMESGRKVERRGGGGPSDPFRYYPAKSAIHA
jgi:hypothetical protein